MATAEEMDLAFSMASEFIHVNEITPVEANMDNLRGLVSQWMREQHGISWALSQESLTQDQRDRYTGRYSAFGRYLGNPDMVAGAAYTILTGTNPPVQTQSGLENMPQRQYAAARIAEEAARGNRAYYGSGDGILSSTPRDLLPRTSRQIAPSTGLPNHVASSEAMGVLANRTSGAVRYGQETVSRFGEPGKPDVSQDFATTPHGRAAVR
jgi:hypothetical protein